MISEAFFLLCQRDMCETSGMQTSLGDATEPVSVIAVSRRLAHCDDSHSVRIAAHGITTAPCTDGQAIPVAEHLAGYPELHGRCRAPEGRRTSCAVSRFTTGCGCYAIH